jgi:hypothetical protein
MKPLN